MGTYVGFDPGGIGRFGWAVVTGETLPLNFVDCGIADHAQGAFISVRSCLNSSKLKINAIGIDAPLFWIRDGDRRADLAVREAVTQRGCPTPGGTVQHVNSLRGACLIQGILVALICQQEIAKDISITESHPKALLWLLGKANPMRRPTDVGRSELAEYVAIDRVHQANEDERDAVLGAVTAYAMKSRLSGWRNLYPLETNPITPLDPEPGYWMPLSPDPRT